MDNERWSGMTSADTPHSGRCWWGWGTVAAMQQNVVAPLISPPSVKEAAAQLRPPRVSLASLPEELQTITTDDAFERLLHSRGRDFVDYVGNLRGPPDAPTDLVAFPRTESDIARLFAHCTAERIAVVPFGGGSSVVFGVNPPEDSAGYRGTITVDMLRFDKVLEVDAVSMCARVQAGVYGPDLERQLKPHGLTLRHFPQSFEFSTLGGWIVTRSGGHFATGPTHIDDLVESVRLVTPSGITETRRLPGSGAGPAEHRFYLGSEGTLGIVTEAWVKVRKAPILRASATLLFRDATSDDAFLKGAEAVRRVSQSGLQPTNLRLVDGPELGRMTHEGGLDNTAVLLVGFESSEEDLDLDVQMRTALHLCTEAGGLVSGGYPDTFVRRGGAGERGGLAGKWGAGFMKGGYTMAASALAGMVVNTFETAVTWDCFFNGFHKEVLAATRRAVQEHCGGGDVTCRFTHVYPDGPAPYYTVMASGSIQPVDRRDEQWLLVKAAAMDAVMRHGGTSTHHHAVGKLHREYYHSELGALHLGSLEAIKRHHDPAWVLNPGVLIDSPRAKL